MKQFLIKGLVAGLGLAVVFTGISFTGQKSMERVTSQVQTLVTEKSDLNGDIDRLKGALEELHNEATSRLDISDSDKKDLQDSINTLNARVKTLENLMKVSTDSLNEVIAQKNDKINQLNGTVTFQVGQLSDMAKELYSTQDKVKELTTSVTDLTNQLADKTTENKKMLEGMKKLSSQVRFFEEATTRLEGRVAELTNELSSEKTAHAQTQARLTASTGLIKKYADQVTDIRAQLVSAQNNVRDLESKLATANTNLGNKDTVIADLTKQITEERDKVTDLTSKLATATDNLKMADERVNTLTKSLHDLQDQYAKDLVQAGNEKKAIQDELDSLKATGRPEDRDRIVTLEKGLEASTKNELALERQLETAKESDKHNSSEVGKIQAEVKRLEGEVDKANKSAQAQFEQVQHILSNDKVDVNQVKQAVDSALASYGKLNK